MSTIPQKVHMPFGWAYKKPQDPTSNTLVLCGRHIKPELSTLWATAEFDMVTCSQCIKAYESQMIGKPTQPKSNEPRLSPMQTEFLRAAMHRLANGPQMTEQDYSVFERQAAILGLNLHLN